MNEINIDFDRESPQNRGTQITINVDGNDKENLLYKVLIGKDGTWTTIKDFSKENKVVWIPKSDGRYIIMAQIKREDSIKSFDYISKREFVIGEAKESIIRQVYLDKVDINVGDKININVETNKIPMLFRYWMMKDSKWELIKDYSPQNVVSLTILSSGLHKVLVECKNLDSDNDYDDFKTIHFNVKSLKKLEIVDFKCLTEEIIVNREILFQVDAKHDDNRMILYKFIKIDANGNSECVQNFSTKRIVSFIEKNSGEYKLLCLAKDMYSPNEYDDRAVIIYNVKKYEDIQIEAFTTDVSSPQIVGNPIELKAIVKGGNTLLYRFIICQEGERCEDSGFIFYNKYIWKPKKSGNYNIIVTVKDKSYEGEFEKKKEIKFTIDEIKRETVRIKDIIFDKKDNYLVGDNINIEVIARGGIELKYSFIIKRHEDGSKLEQISYGSCNWVNFVPEECGVYDFEILVKDKYSKREYDCHEVIQLEVKDYIPANIDYVLKYPRENYIVGDKICLQVIARDTKNVLVKYVLKINGHIVEETKFLEDKEYELLPRCKGNYCIEIYGKNKRSKKEYDCKKIVNLCVRDSMPITNTKIISDKVNFKCNEVINFSVKNDGGKNVIYEFYLMEKGEWRLIQKYSKKNFYSFIPFSCGKYKILAICKSMYTELSYEDYDILEFNVK